MKTSSYKKRIHLDRKALTLQAGLRNSGVSTVCEAARCPNKGECFSRGVATFLILGEVCSRNCRFCAIPSGNGRVPDPEEPKRIVEATVRQRLRHVVITSVTRDDLEDGGAGQFARVVEVLHKTADTVTVEVLIPDLKGNTVDLDTVINSRPDVFNHNMETVPSLYPKIRPEARYRRSLEVLAYAKSNAPGMYTKTGIMVGLGESINEIRQLMTNVRTAGCDILTIGQYFQPVSSCVPVKRYLEDEEFRNLESMGKEAGFRYVSSGRFVRSSHKAGEILRTVSGK